MLINNGAGYWASDGKSSENLFFDDLRYGSLVGAWSAHFGPPQKKMKKKATLLTTPQNPNIEDLFSRATRIITQSKGCAEYLENLMSKAQDITHRSPNNSSIRSILKAVSEQGRIVYGDTIKKFYGVDGATIHGNIQFGNARIELPFPTPFQSYQSQAVHDRMAEQFAEQKAWDNAIALIHESFHLAGYSDSELMKAAAVVAKVDPPDFSNLTANDRTIEESRWWSYKLRAACSPVN